MQTYWSWPPGGSWRSSAVSSVALPRSERRPDALGGLSVITSTKTSTARLPAPDPQTPEGNPDTAAPTGRRADGGMLRLLAFARRRRSRSAFGQYRPSIGATVTRSFTALASCRSSVINASAWSWVRATYSALKVSGHPAGRRPSMRRSEGRGLPAAGSAAGARSRAPARPPSPSSHRGSLPGTEATAPANAEAPEPGSDARRESRSGREPAEATSGPITYLVMEISSPQLLRHASACPKYRDVEPAQHACAADPDRQLGRGGTVAVRGSRMAGRRLAVPLDQYAPRDSPGAVYPAGLPSPGLGNSRMTARTGASGSSRSCRVCIGLRREGQCGLAPRIASSVCRVGPVAAAGRYRRPAPRYQVSHP